jgi:uncharacterized protein
MLRVDLRAAAAGPVETDAVLAPTDPALADLATVPTSPVVVSGRLMAAGTGSYYWAGLVRTQVEATCRRCLAPVLVDVDEPVRLLFTEDEDNDDPAAVILPPRAVDIDLGDAVREALILAIPEFPLCREDCRGLCARCGTDLNRGECRCAPAADPRWGALEALRNDTQSR